jgi:hypothetical protein
MRNPWCDFIGFLLVVLIIVLYYNYGLLDYYLPETYMKHPEVNVDTTVVKEASKLD